VSESAAIVVRPTVLAGIPGRLSGAVDSYRLRLVCTCGNAVEYPTVGKPSVYEAYASGIMPERMQLALPAAGETS
jgi:hypothetical protein